MFADELSSNKEEAYAKLPLHAKHAFNAHSDKAVLIRSPSGDVDNNMLFLAMLQKHANGIYVDFDMLETWKSALVGF